MTGPSISVCRPPATSKLPITEAPAPTDTSNSALDLVKVVADQSAVVFTQPLIRINFELGMFEMSMDLSHESQFSDT